MSAGKSATNHIALGEWNAKMQPTLCAIVAPRARNCAWMNLVIKGKIDTLDARQGLKGPRIVVYACGKRTIFAPLNPFPYAYVRDQEGYLREYYTGDLGRAIGQKL